MAAGVRDGTGPLELADAAVRTPNEVMATLGTAPEGLAPSEAAARLARFGPNALRSHGARPWEVLARQVRNPLLLLLVAAALVSVFVGERVDAVIIFVIVSLSVGLGFLNEYRSELAVEALHSQIRHRTVVRRAGHAVELDVTQLVPGDVVRLQVGDIVPADLRLIESHELECDEAVLTGESVPVEKVVDRSPGGESALDLPSCAFMGTVVQTGEAWAVVVRTGPATEFGSIAMQLGERHAETAFQRGLRQFSQLLVRVTALLVIAIFVLNIAFRHPLLDALLFSLAIAIGLTPQLLPAIVTISLAAGSRRLARQRVVAKRLVSIEDLGDLEVLLTDKTGTLTEGRISFSSAIDATGTAAGDVLTLGLVCNEAVVENGVAVGGNQLDRALWEGAGTASALVAGWTRVATVPFDFQRRMVSVLAGNPAGSRRLITKGAPESLRTACGGFPAEAERVLDEQFAAGHRVVAVASKRAADLQEPTAADEKDLVLEGFLVFLDPPKAGVGGSIERLRRLGIEVKVVTGDNDRVAVEVCGRLQMPVLGTLVGSQIDALDDEELQAAARRTSIFARVTPEQKARLIRAHITGGKRVGFLGDGVNDAVALHSADVGISVDSATDVAKDAADIVLLEKDLDVLAGGVIEGRRIFSNTIKYVLMATSSNFGNMFSAAGASLFLPFLPMLPSQILLNNLLYDVSETTIPTDEVDAELLERPAHWDIAFIRRFMSFFGPISSVFDFLTFFLLLWGLGAGAKEFHSGWFVESLATQTLVIFVIRTRRVPFFRSRPSVPLLVTSLSCVVVGLLLPYSPLASVLGFVALPPLFLLALVGMIVTYLTLAELGKARFFAPERGRQPLARHVPSHERHVQRRASRWSHRRRAGAPA